MRDMSKIDSQDGLIGLGCLFVFVVGLLLLLFVFSKHLFNIHTHIGERVCVCVRARVCMYVIQRVFTLIIYMGLAVPTLASLTSG